MALRHNDPVDTTGLKSLDEALSGIQAGDNIVWHVDGIAEYRAFVTPYVAAAVRDRRRLIYFRFARHEPLVPDDVPCERHALAPETGFENFIHTIHRVIGEAGVGAYYVFDCLSDLATDWYSDAMLGNFFMLTCPYLFKLDTIAYFGLLRRRQSRNATEPIQGTTQLFLDVFRHAGDLYVRPIKTQFRYTPTIHLLHVWRRPDDRFEVVTSSAVIARVLAEAGPDWSATETYGDEIVRRAEEIVSAGAEGKYSAEEAASVRRQIVRMMVTRDESMLPLIERYLTLPDLLAIRGRHIGTGLIGGKTVGMLVARRIVEAHAPETAARLEPHDSFYIGADVFYTFLVRNGLWPYRERQIDVATFLDGVDEAQQKILDGTFPDHVLRSFEEMLDYFGQYPVIVRSSSLLEDNFGNAFAGKYESVFCANQGTREERFAAFLNAVRTVYASTMSAEALSYRARHGILNRDEQMALLVMRVTGAIRGRAFYPDLAGVGFSYNPFAWSSDIDPQAGVLRLVYGLGTRAVERVDDDYTRVVALNAPLRRPESDFDEIVRHSQRRMDYIDLDADALRSGDFQKLVANGGDAPISLFASQDPQTDSSSGNAYWFLTFEDVLTRTGFVEDMRVILKTLERTYAHPVDIEFAANFVDRQEYRINLLQCRPLRVSGSHRTDLPEVTAAPADRLLEAVGAVVGNSRVMPVDWIIFVDPAGYGVVPERQRYAIARAIGRINGALGQGSGGVLAIGPGRWGTSLPALGIPVEFSEINRVSAVCELAMMHAHLTPDISLGTHFFGELVELDLLYFALFPGKEGNRIDLERLRQAPNRLPEVAPEAVSWSRVLRVVAANDLVKDGQRLFVHANTPQLRVVCYSSA